MSTNFPTALDAFVDPLGNQSLNNPPHSQQHAKANDALAALEIKVGINASTDTTSLDYKVTQLGAKGVANGVAGLDGNGQVPVSELPVDTINIVVPANLGGATPNFSLGLNGDFVLDISGGKFWGPKSSGLWPATPNWTFTTH